MKIKPSRLREIIQEEVSQFNSRMSAPPDDITGEPDDEGAMARSQLLKLAKYSAALMDMMNDDTQLPAWVQAKITKSASYLGAVKHFIEGELELNEEKKMKISKQKLERIIKEEVLKEMRMQVREEEELSSGPFEVHPRDKLKAKSAGETQEEIRKATGKRVRVEIDDFEEGFTIYGDTLSLADMKKVLEYVRSEDGMDEPSAEIKTEYHIDIGFD